MFTGLVETTGTVTAVDRSMGGARIHLQTPWADSPPGDSVAVNGCCLTIVTNDHGLLGFDLLDETLARTNLHRIAPGALVNLERALAAAARLGGHFVQGHIDCFAKIIALDPHGADHRLEIELPREFAHYVAYKGSIAVNGISLTVAEVRDTSFVLWLIPHTIAVTNLRATHPGDLVNLEFDILAKYVERILALHPTSSPSPSPSPSSSPSSS